MFDLKLFRETIAVVENRTKKESLSNISKVLDDMSKSGDGADRTIFSTKSLKTFNQNLNNHIYL